MISAIARAWFNSFLWPSQMGSVQGVEGNFSTKGYRFQRGLPAKMLICSWSNSAHARSKISGSSPFFTAGFMSTRLGFCARALVSSACQRALYGAVDRFAARRFWKNSYRLIATPIVATTAEMTGHGVANHEDKLTTQAAWASVMLSVPHFLGPAPTGPFSFSTHSSSQLPAPLVAAEVPTYA